MTRNRKIALGIIIFLLLETALIAFVDRPLSEYLRRIDAQQHGLIDFFRSYTDYAKSKWFLWPSGIGLIFCAAALRLSPLRLAVRKQLRSLGQDCLLIFAAVSITGILTDILKPIIGRARPVELARDGAYGFHPLTFNSVWNSMPSGHATSAFALAAVLTILCPRLKFLWIALGIAFALSRVMVNAHYLSDTIAGGALGYIAATWIVVRFNHNGTDHWKESIFPIDRKPGAF